MMRAHLAAPLGCLLLFVALCTQPSDSRHNSTIKMTLSNFRPPADALSSDAFEVLAQRYNITVPDLVPTQPNNNNNNNNNNHNNNQDVEILDLEQMGPDHFNCTCTNSLKCPQKRVVQTGARCRSNRVCCSHSEYVRKCGRPYLEPSGTVPWMASIMLAVSGGHLVMCAGSLIHSSAVVTAARCFDHLSDSEKSRLIVRLGDDDLLHPNITSPFQDIQVDRLVLHENYTFDSKQNDIAVVFLREPAQLGDQVDTSCVRRDVTHAADQCFLTTYGLERQHSETAKLYQNFDNALKQTRTPLDHADFSTCQSILRSSSKSFDFALHETFFCSHAENACDLNVDKAGSPVTCRDGQTGEHRLVGLVSWGVGCWSNKQPGVFTNVSTHFMWLDRTLVEYFGYFESYFSFIQQ